MKNKIEEAKKSLYTVALEKAEAEKRFAQLHVKINAICEEAEAEAVSNLLVKHCKFAQIDANDKQAMKTATAKISAIVKENYKPLRKELVKLAKPLKPKYYTDELKNLYIAYVEALTSGNNDKFDEAKKALQTVLEGDFAVVYSLKTCASLLASVGLTRGTLTERAEGLLVKPRNEEDFARMLMNSIYQQLQKEGVKIAQKNVDAIIYGLDEQAQQACKKAEKMLANFS